MHTATHWHAHACTHPHMYTCARTQTHTHTHIEGSMWMWRWFWMSSSWRMFEYGCEGQWPWLYPILATGNSAGSTCVAYGEADLYSVVQWAVLLQLLPPGLLQRLLSRYCHSADWCVGIDLSRPCPTVSTGFLMHCRHQLSLFTAIPSLLASSILDLTSP